MAKIVMPRFAFRSFHKRSPKFLGSSHALSPVGHIFPLGIKTSKPEEPRLVGAGSANSPGGSQD